MPAATLALTTTKRPVSSLARRASADHRRYLRAAITSKYNLAGPSALAIFALAPSGWPLLLLGLVMQLVVLLALPRMAWYRRKVDESDTRQKQEEAAAARAAVLLRISQEHRQRFEHMEALVDEISDRVDRTHAATDVGGCFGLRGLLSSYLSLAIAHKAARQHLSCTSREVLCDEIERLSSLRSTSPRLQTLYARRLAIAEQRHERWDRTAAEYECLSSQMDAIEAMVQLTFESVSATVDVDGAAGRVERAIADFAAERGTLDEIVALGGADDGIDPRIFTAPRTPVRPLEDALRNPLAAALVKR